MFVLFITLILISTTGYAADKYIVRVIYFRAQDTAPVNHAKYDRIIKDMQAFFRTEMIRHGFGDKTFKIETDAKGDLIIHTVNGKHPGDHYTGEIFNAYYNKMSKEIPFEINNTTNRIAQNDIYIVIVGGVEIVNDGLGSPWGGGWTFLGNTLGGTAIINENFEKLYPNHYKSIIGHEFGHTLGWQHNKSAKALMGPLPFGDFGRITEFEAQLLNKHKLFNDVHVLNTPPEIVGNLVLTAIGTDTVRFEVLIKGNVNLYYCQLTQYQDYIGSTKLENKEELIQIDVSRHLISDNARPFKFLVLDSNGNRGQKSFRDIQLPEPKLDGNNESTLKYLTIRDKHPDSLTPINNELEWVGWENAGVFEKMPNGVAQKLPNWYVHVPHLDEWNSWFYSHAKAQFFYDISGGTYNQFETYFYLPNPCKAGRTVEVICFADDVEIYHSGILRPPEAQNKHLVTAIPEGSKKFMIQITDGGDGIHCDHFVFGEAKVIQILDETIPDNEIKNEDPDNVVCEDCIPDIDKELNVVIEEDLGINPKSKLTTIWATIKLDNKHRK